MGVRPDRSLRGGDPGGSAPRPTPLWRRPLPWYLGLLVLFVVLRVLQSLGAAGSFDDEDGYTLAAAWELLHHPVWPYQTYQLSEWENGSLITVLIAAPLAWILGPSVMAIKMTGLTISCVTLTGLFLLCRQAAGLAAGVLVGVIYIAFPSPIYTYSVTAHGFHPDSMALQTLLLWLCLRWYRPDTTARRFLVLGWLAGFSIYFAYISVVAVVAGLGPWIARRLLRRPGVPPLRWIPLAGGFGLGVLPILIFNIFNDFRGFQIYHGSVADYVSPTGLSDKLSWFLAHTVDPLRHFANPVDENDPFYGKFEAIFWVVAAVCLLWPFARWLAGRVMRRIRGGAVAAAAPAPSQVDWMLLTFPLLTLAVFFTSKHPIGPMHLVPLLVVLVAAMAVRLGQVWRWRGLLGRALVGVALVPYLLYTVPLQAAEIRPERFGLALALDGRNYPLFLYRARDVYDNNRPAGDHFAIMAQEKRLDAVRTMLLTLRLEHAKNDEHLVHHYLVPVLHHHDPLSALSTILANPPPAQSELVPAEVAGLTLMNLYLNKKISQKRMTAWLATQPPARVDGVVEVLGFYLPPQPELIDALGAVGRTLAGERGEQQVRRAFARGYGRSWSVRALEDPRRGVCERDEVPAALMDAYVEGVGYGVARLAVRPLPRWLEERVCPARREAFRRGVRRAGTPGERVLVRTHTLD